MCTSLRTYWLAAISLLVAFVAATAAFGEYVVRCMFRWNNTRNKKQQHLKRIKDCSRWLFMEVDMKLDRNRQTTARRICDIVNKWNVETVVEIEHSFPWICTIREPFQMAFHWIASHSTALSLRKFGWQKAKKVECQTKKKGQKISSTENEEEVNNSRRICIIQWLILPFFCVTAHAHWRQN